MRTVTSADGTAIAFEQAGTGPALILVGGALEYRALDLGTAHLAADPLLAQHVTVVQYDRRGRGESTATPPYAVEREIDDLAALIAAVGGTAFVFGQSSGAALALEAAAALGPMITKLALYDVPYNSEQTARQAWRTYRQHLSAVLAQGRRGEAVALFALLAGMPAGHLDQLPQHPLWPQWEAVAPTLAYDAAVLGEDAAVPIATAARVAVPALVINGGASYPFMHATARALAAALPRATQRTLEGQAHEVAPHVLAPVLVEFFTGCVAPPSVTRARSAQV